MIKIKTPIFSENQKLFAQGAAAANLQTKIAAAAMADPANHALSERITAPIVSSDQIHQVSGCSDLIERLLLL
jgi:hypothetical protein